MLSQLCSVIKDFIYSTNLRNVVNLKMKLNTLFAKFCVYLLKRSTTSRQGLNRLMTKFCNIPELLEYGDFYKIISLPIKCVLEELLSRFYLHLELLLLNRENVQKFQIVINPRRHLPNNQHFFQPVSQNKPTTFQGSRSEVESAGPN